MPYMWPGVFTVIMSPRYYWATFWYRFWRVVMKGVVGVDKGVHWLAFWFVDNVAMKRLDVQLDSLKAERDTLEGKQ